MRKMSQEGGDNTSITSGIENEVKKCGPGILKSTRNSIKRQVQNSISTESNDTAIQPLLPKSKEKSEIEKQSAKFLLSKTDFASTKYNDRNKLLADDKIGKPSITDITGITDTSGGSDLKDLKQDISQSLSAVSIHNHMTTNVFDSPLGIKNTVVSENLILVEVDTSKPSGYVPSPLIFTTAKIHTDGKVQQILPVQNTPVPILSTVESGVVKTETNIKELDKNNETALISSGSCVINSNLLEKRDCNGSIKRLQDKTNDMKVNVSLPLCRTVAQTSNISKITSTESMKTKNGQPTGPKEVTRTDTQKSQQAFNSYGISNSAKTDCTKTALTDTRSAIDKSYININKNFQPENKTDGGINNENKKKYCEVMSSQPSCKSSINIGIKPDATLKEEEMTMNAVTNTIETKYGHSQETKTATSKLKSPDQQALQITRNAIKVKTTPNSNPVSKESAAISPYPSDKEQASIKTINTSITKISTALSSNDKADSVISPKTSDLKANHSMKSISNINKSSELNSLAKSIRTTGQELSLQSKPFDSKTFLSNVPKSTMSTAVNSASVSPQMNKVSTNAIAKTNTTTINKTSANINTTATLSGTEDSILPSCVSSTLATTADESKVKTNNVATIVSSISKTTTTTSITTKSNLDMKQRSSPSTVKTISSVPTFKSTVVGTAHPDKTNVKGISPTVKPTSTLSNKTSPASSILKTSLAAKGTSTVTAPSTRGVATTPTKPATQPSTYSAFKPSEAKRDDKIQKPDIK